MNNTDSVHLVNSILVKYLPVRKLSQGERGELKSLITEDIVAKLRKSISERRVGYS